MMELAWSFATLQGLPLDCGETSFFARSFFFFSFPLLPWGKIRRPVALV
jgi:hypothetical protein